MYKVLIIIIIKLFIISHVSLLPAKKMKINDLYEVQSHVLKAVKEIFLLLKINQNFTTNNRNRFLLKMHEAMKIIAVRNSEKFEHIRRAARLNTKKKPKDGLFDLDKLIKILIIENLVPDHHINLFKKSENNNSIHLKITSLEIPEKSEEAFAFLREYFYQLCEVELLEAVNSPLNKIRNTYNKNKKIRNLKKWAASNVTRTEKHPNDTRRIFGSMGASIRMYAFVASVHVMGDFVCGGSIISHIMVITAATCVQIAYNNSRFLQDNKYGITVRIGSVFSLRFGTLCSVFKIHFHPHFDPVALRNNLAILMIDDQLSKKNKIRRIEYQNVRGPLAKNIRSISLLGWGDKVAKGYNGVDRLSISKIDIFNLEKCKNTYSRKFVTDSNFCTGFETTGSGACQRDVGGPGIFNSKLVGVVSFGPPSCGLPGAPTAFTDLGHYVDWIDGIVKKVPVNQHDVKKTNKMLHLNRAMGEPMHNVLPEGDLRARLDKNIRRIKAKPDPKHLKVLNYLLDVLIGENSNEFKSDRSRKQYTMQEAVKPIITKHVHNFRPTRSQKKAMNYNLGSNNSNYNKHSTIHRAMKDLRGYVGFSDVIEKEKGDASSKTQLKSEQAHFTTSQGIFVKNHGNHDSIPQMLWQKNEKINKHQTKSAYINNKMKKPDLRYSDGDETDNYESESENGLSIEIASEIPLAVAMSTTKSVAMQRSKLITKSNVILPQRKTVFSAGKRYRILTDKPYPTAITLNRAHDVSNSFFRTYIPENIVIPRAKVSKPVKNQYNIDYNSISNSFPTLAAQIQRSMVARSDDSMFLQKQDLKKVTVLVNDSSNESTDSEIDSSSYERVIKNNKITDNEFTLLKVSEKDTNAFRNSYDSIQKTTLRSNTHSSFGSERDETDDRQTKQYLLNKKDPKFGTQIIDVDAIDENQNSTFSYFRKTQKELSISSTNNWIEKEPLTHSKEKQIETDFVMTRNKLLQSNSFSNSQEEKKETEENFNVHLQHKRTSTHFMRNLNNDGKISPSSDLKIKHHPLQNQPKSHEEQDIETSTYFDIKQNSLLQEVPFNPSQSRHMKISPNIDSQSTDKFLFRELLTLTTENQIIKAPAYDDVQNYATTMTSTDDQNTSLNTTTPTPVTTIISTAAGKALQKTMTNTALVRIRSASEDDSFLDTDMVFPFETTNNSMTRASSSEDSHYPQSAEEDEYDHYNQMLSQFFGEGMSDILNSS